MYAQTNKKDNHHYASPQCGAPFYSLPNTPFDSSRIGIQGEFGGIGHNVSIEQSVEPLIHRKPPFTDHFYCSLWNVQAAIDTINQTYEISDSIWSWNHRGHVLLAELLDQVRRFGCSGGIWTQTTDVEGEVNGLLTYDRRIIRTDEAQWRQDIQNLYDAAAARDAGVVARSVPGVLASAAVSSTRTPVPVCLAMVALAFVFVVA
jgi:hypothetical protein